MKNFLNNKDDKTPPILIMAGLRRIGKTTLLLQLQEEFPDSLYINFRDNTWHPQSNATINGVDANDVMFKFLRQCENGKHPFPTLLLDEFTSSAHYEEFSRDLYNCSGDTEWRVKTVITGSSPAHLYKLSTSSLGGSRSHVFTLPVLTFVEYLWFTDKIPSYCDYQAASIQDFKDYLILKDLHKDLAVTFDRQYFISLYAENEDANNMSKSGRAITQLGDSSLLQLK